MSALFAIFVRCLFAVYLIYNFIIIVRLIIVRELNTYNFFLESRVPLMFSEHDLTVDRYAIRARFEKPQQSIFNLVQISLVPHQFKNK